MILPGARAMLPRMNTRFLSALLTAGLALVNAANAAGPTAYPFFPFCIDWHDAKKRGFAEQATMLKELGYDGVRPHLSPEARRTHCLAGCRRAEAVPDHDAGEPRPDREGAL